MVGPDGYGCHECKQIFYDWAKWREHVERVHNSRVSSEDGPPFKCPLCTSTFDSLSAVARHAHWHESPMYECYFCSLPFFTRTDRERHLISGRCENYVHVKETFPCSFCYAEFATSVAVSRHVQQEHPRSSQQKEREPCQLQWVPEDGSVENLWGGSVNSQLTGGEQWTANFGVTLPTAEERVEVSSTDWVLDEDVLWFGKH